MVASKKRILIVDDILHWRKLLASILGEYELGIFDNYEDAASAISQSRFDIAILDVRLDDDNVFNVDGIGLLKKIRKHQPEVKIVILTGYRESVRDQALREYMPDEIFTKDAFNNDEFRMVIHNLAFKTHDR